jgi:hypothetical protein
MGLGPPEEDEKHLTTPLLTVPGMRGQTGPGRSPSFFSPFLFPLAL